jgi:hypothetical protein
MENFRDFMELGQRVFFTFIHSSSRHRSFSYSGILDVDCAGNGSNLVINHASTQIVINGSGLELLHKEIIDENVKFVYENKGFQNENGKLHKITEIFYLDAKEHDE